MKPTPKMAGVGVAGALALILVWALGQLGVVMPPEVAAAVSVVLAWGVGYLVREKAPAANDGGR